MMTTTYTRIQDYEACRKCESDELALRYDPVSDKIDVTCDDCGYVERCLPADYIERAVASIRDIA